MLTGSVEDGLALMRVHGSIGLDVAGQVRSRERRAAAEVRSLVLFGDTDEASRAAVARARMSHETRGLRVAELFLTLGKDANAEWIARNG